MDQLPSKLLINGQSDKLDKVVIFTLFTVFLTLSALTRCLRRLHKDHISTKFKLNISYLVQAVLSNKVGTGSRLTNGRCT